MTRYPVPSVPPESLHVTVGDFRRAVKGSTWKVNENLKDSDPLPIHPTGTYREAFPQARPALRINWKKVFSTPPRNPELLRIAVKRGLISRDALALLPQSPRPEKKLAPRKQRRGRRSTEGTSKRSEVT
jgi:hypothetical protein